MHRRHTGIPVPGQVELHRTGCFSTPNRHRAYRSLGDGNDAPLGPRQPRRRRRSHRRRIHSSAWTHGSPPVEVTLLLQDSVLTIEVSDAGAGLAVFAGSRPLGAAGHGLAAAVDIAQQIGIDGGAWGTRVWAQLHFQWLPAQTEPGTAAA